MEEDPNQSPSPYDLLFQALSLIPIRHYLFALFLISTIFFYNFLEFHFLGDTFLRYFRCRVDLIYNPDSPLYHGVVSRCRILHGRYVATPWLASPHLQTCFLNFHGLPPVFSYRRQLFRASDGGTIALDWLTSSDVLDGALHNQSEITKEDTTPIAVVIPGLTSDSSSVIEESKSSGKQEPSINQGPYLNIAEDGRVAAVKYEQDTNTTTPSGTSNHIGPKAGEDVTKRSFKELCRQTKRSIWWLGYIGVVTSFPLLGMLLNYLLRKKQQPTKTAKS